MTHDPLLQRARSEGGAASRTPAPGSLKGFRVASPTSFPASSAYSYTNDQLESLRSSLNCAAGSSETCTGPLPRRYLNPVPEEPQEASAQYPKPKEP